MKAILFLLYPLLLFSINWTDPSINDFNELEKTLKESKNPLLHYLETRSDGTNFWPPRKYSYQNFKFTKDGNFDKDVHVITFGEHNKEIAICTYSSIGYNRRGKSPEYFFQQRIKELENFGFVGDFIYQLGGYPNIEEGDLKLFDVPYAFKIAMIRRVKRMGYKKIVWLDNILEITKPLDDFFRLLSKRPIFLKRTKWKFQDFCHRHILKKLHVKEDEIKQIRHYDTTILGFNFENSKARRIFDEWYNLTKEKELFFSPFPEQIPLAILIHRHRARTFSKCWHLFFNHSYSEIK